MKKVLIVEDSTMVTKVVRHVLGQSDQLELICASDFASAQALMEQHGADFFVALVDLHLPDAPHGEVVDYTLSQSVPTIVLTARIDAELRKQLLGKGVLDYIIKEGRYSYEYVKNLLHRLIKNEGMEVLVVDDSQPGRRLLRHLLEMHRYRVFEAADGVAAIKQLVEHPDIRLMITDYNMPGMNGCELVQSIRTKYEKTDLVIIGLSSESDDTLSARFIKSGANDFLKKPISQEELYCRVTHNVEMLEMMDKLRDAAQRDYCTGAYNRHYFFEQGQHILSAAQARSTAVAAVAMVIDGFSQLKLQYGNAGCDLIMAHIANRLMQSFDGFMLARDDGQEFLGLITGLDSAAAATFVEQGRRFAGAAPIEVNGHSIQVTLSAGLYQGSEGDLEQRISNASQYLRRAKEAGGALLISDD